MSSAKKDKTKFVLCLHISRFGFVLFYRAKPVTETACPRFIGYGAAAESRCTAD